MSVMTPSRTTTWIRSHPVPAYLVLSLGGAYALLSVMVLIERDVLPGRGVPGLIGSDMEEAASFVLVLTVLASALLVTYVEGGRSAVRQLVRRAFRWRVPARWWAIAALSLPVVSFLLALALGDSFTPPSAGTLVHEGMAMLFALAVINLAEETGWAGFLQSRLERRNQFLLASALTAVPFALVHVPIRVVTREIAAPEDLVGNQIALLVLCLVIRTLLGVVLRGALNSVLLVAVTHTSFNRSNNADGIVADLVDGDARTFAALLASLAVTVVLLVAMRRRLSRFERLTLDQNEAA